MNTLITPKMVSDAALAYLSQESEFLKRIRLKPSLLTARPDTRTKWQKVRSSLRGKVHSWRHSLACWITPYGFDE